MRPLLDSLHASAGQGSGIPVLPLDLERPTRRRSPSPDAVRLEQAVEEARRDSLKLEERRQNILDKVEKLEKKKLKHQQDKKPYNPSKEASTSSKMADSDPVEVQEENRAPREPPIVYKGIQFKLIHLLFILVLPAFLLSHSSFTFFLLDGERNSYNDY